MFFRCKESNWRIPLPGILRREAAVGSTAQIIEFRLNKGTIVPLHQHPNEQIGILISGKVLLRVGTDERTLVPGDGYSIEPGVDHSAESLEDSIVLDVFSPPREEYRD